jgi:hypothetical protein
MHIDQQPWRQLYDDFLEYDGDALFRDLLQPWLAANDGERRWLESVRDRRGDPVPAVAPAELWRLYALSRIVELLQLSFAPRRIEGGWDVASVTADEHARFMGALGMEAIDRAAFHPFCHEVVTVDTADDDAPPEVAEVYWPGWRLGPLLIARAGCRVRAGRRHLVKEIAENSTLYWAFARTHRPTDDPSRGWGSNSQWRTAFRRDYALDGALYYNVDGRESPGGVDPELDEADRMELLRHRCFVTRAKRHDDRWPYGFRLVEHDEAAAVTP